MKSSCLRSRRRGFTLVEVLLVLVILVIIASVATTSIIAMQRRAYNKAAELQVRLFKPQLECYHLDTGEFPSTEQGLEALRNPPAGLANPETWAGPYTDENIPLDPWNEPYQYVCPGQNRPDRYDLWSTGPDKRGGTEDDIGNW